MSYGCKEWGKMGGKKALIPAEDTMETLWNRRHMSKNLSKLMQADENNDKEVESLITKDNIFFP